MYVCHTSQTGAIIKIKNQSNVCYQVVSFIRIFACLLPCLFLDLFGPSCWIDAAISGARNYVAVVVGKCILGQNDFNLGQNILN